MVSSGVQQVNLDPGIFEESKGPTPFSGSKLVFLFILIKWKILHNKYIFLRIYLFILAAFKGINLKHIVDLLHMPSPKDQASSIKLSLLSRYSSSFPFSGSDQNMSVRRNKILVSHIQCSNYPRAMGLVHQHLAYNFTAVRPRHVARTSLGVFENFYCIENVTFYFGTFFHQPLTLQEFLLPLII